MKVKSNKKAQEEMVGFALIIIIVAVIIIIFLGFSLSKSPKENVESYEVDSFIQAFLQYTTDCSDNIEFLSIQKLIFACSRGESCKDERGACSVLETTLNGIVKESWKIENRPIEGYKLTIKSNGADVLNMDRGNVTKNYKGSVQDFSRSGNSIEILFTAYY